jgi:hypothetical protein
LQRFASVIRCEDRSQSKWFSFQRPISRPLALSRAHCATRIALRPIASILRLIK